MVWISLYFPFNKLTDTYASCSLPISNVNGPIYLRRRILTKAKSSPNFSHLHGEAWTTLEMVPSPYPISVLCRRMTLNPDIHARVYAFLAGAMISLGPGSEPFVIWGAILKLWEGSGGRNGKFGRPIMDEKELSDGGRCQQFQKPSGFHIHKYNGVAKE
jgi:hypothetical protein